MAVVAVLAAVAIGAAWWRQTAVTPVPPLRFGVMEWPGFYHLHVAAARGGTVTVVSLPDNPSINQAFAEGRLEVAVMVLTDAVILASHGVDVRIIAAIDHSTQADVILARPGIAGFADLKGKRLSFDGVNTFSHLFVLNALERAKVHEGDVRMVDLPATEVPAALLDGRLDAGHTWGSLAVAAQAKGCRPRAAGCSPTLAPVRALSRKFWSPELTFLLSVAAKSVGSSTNVSLPRWSSPPRNRSYSPA
jgi:ABC-type nitrate/sulfonate/bicarbonate transport system substrate-binding protein